MRVRKADDMPELAFEIDRVAALAGFQPLLRCAPLLEGLGAHAGVGHGDLIGPA